jgi:hypothetical protein
MAVAAAPVVSMVRLTGSIIGASRDIFLSLNWPAKSADDLHQ